MPCQVIKCDYPDMKDEVAPDWSMNAKNSSPMKNGFRSFQLVLGRNLNLPSVMIDKPPALHGATMSEALQEYLNAFHATRKAYTS